MIIETYCDETHPDLFTSKKPRARYLMFGSLWLPSDMRKEAKNRIGVLRRKHSVWGEMKWTKVSPSKQAFYIELMELFATFGPDMCFRCIAVDRKGLGSNHEGDDSSLGFNEFYFELLHRWIEEPNEYRVFCDLKTNRKRKHMKELLHRLGGSHPTARIGQLQSLPSSKVVLLQLCDVLLGAASSRLNKQLGKGTAKEAVARSLEEQLGMGGPIGHSENSEGRYIVHQVNHNGGR